MDATHTGLQRFRKMFPDFFWFQFGVILVQFERDHLREGWCQFLAQHAQKQRGGDQGQLVELIFLPGFSR